ncbi:hypothetical protein Btru_063383 [Bulinus truncatus]|nr:hypothetical protein Btru_063383 [Bulinus truncatus]
MTMVASVGDLIGSWTMTMEASVGGHMGIRNMTMEASLGGAIWLAGLSGIRTRTMHLRTTGCGTARLDSSAIQFYLIYGDQTTVEYKANRDGAIKQQLSIRPIEMALSNNSSSCNQCILHMQDHCKNENEALIKAEQEHKLAELCSSLYDIFRCVAFREFECLEIAMQTLDHHTHSPHGCPLGQEIVIELQQIGENASANKMATSTGQPETSTIETSPTTVAIVTNITDSVQSGNKEEHTGSKTHNSASRGKMAGLEIHILTVLGLTLTSFLQRNILS